ncbi:uncharacterized protein BX664DRAFT_337706 [Halteromyces radiatus]|uniref:uncharacterized protein n=1 Tax=Halteromyces radiatus TaxID=101107 RepID=UPI00221ED0EC|nr:uncharacterized protein BX664DRAFT_337706 [Halteromyces radiatus]KAI8084757.1 hypothetical protein BX664DRAFT_337706 [Halteromyces radiatus]
MNSEAPVNAGHVYANAAEDYEDRELWTEAIQAHENAAEQFQKALEYTQDAEAGKSLRLLMANHTRKAKDLERKVAKSLQEQQQRQKERQLLQQKQQQQQQQPNIYSPTSEGNKQRPLSGHIIGAGGLNSSGKDGINMNGLLNALPATPSSPRGNSSGQIRLDKNKNNDASQHGTIGESYALLSTDNDEEDDDDASDPFNKFFQAVETLVEQLSNPVAFASAPLNEDDIPTPYHQKLLSADNTTNYPSSDNSTTLDHPIDMSTMMESFFFVPEHDGGATESSSGSSASSTTGGGQEKIKLQMENEQLKRRVEQLSRRLMTLEKTAEESHMLKSSILQFRNDVQRQAKRIMQTHDSASLRTSSVALLGNSGINGVGSTHHSYPRHPGMNQTTGSTSELVTRLKETEEENRRLKDQIEKQQVLMKKYQERWEKLKESAKKRRAQPSDITNNNTKNNSDSGHGGGMTPEYHRPYSSRPPALLRSLAQQSTSAHHPPFASSSLARSSRIASDDCQL